MTRVWPRAFVQVAFGVAAVADDTFARPRTQSSGSMTRERSMRLPGDEIIEDVMTHYMRAITITRRRLTRCPPAGGDR